MVISGFRTNLKIYNGRKMKKTIFRVLITFTFLFFTFTLAYANNLSISNMEVREIDTTAKTAVIRFDISWDNSWRDTSNYDAVWVFAKFKDSSDEWQHVKLSSSGTNPTGYDVGEDGDTASSGNRDNIEIIVPTDKVGCFIQRSENETGTLDRDKVELLWDYDAGGLISTDLDDISLQLFGIEMTYIPSGSFSVGDTESDYGQFEEGTLDTPLEITSEDVLTLGGGGAGSLGNNNATGMMFTPDDFNDATSKTLPAVFPKGYDGFYCMKYEISQGQYMAFLNTLTLDQQDTRTADDLSSNDAATHYVMSGDNQTTVSYRNGLYAQTNPGASTPYVISCDVDDNGTPDESDDGKWIACSYISWMDGCAYADWAGLRPMTELEFEKVCRGSLTPIADEYAWGSTDLTQAEGAVQNPGENDEVANTTGNGLANYDGAGTDISGPLRVGFAAAGATSRVSSGSGYYGNLNMSDNVIERAVTVGNSTGRLFTGSHGDGILTSNGNGDNSDWPGYVSTEVTGASGSGFRGGSWGSFSAYMQVSGRVLAADTATNRNNSYGFRLVREDL